jgi:hypothetical protein
MKKWWTQLQPKLQQTTTHTTTTTMLLILWNIFRRSSDLQKRTFTNKMSSSEFSSPLSLYSSSSPPPSYVEDPIQFARRAAELKLDEVEQAIADMFAKCLRLMEAEVEMGQSQDMYASMLNNPNTYRYLTRDQIYAAIQELDEQLIPIRTQLVRELRCKYLFRQQLETILQYCDDEELCQRAMDLKLQLENLGNPNAPLEESPRMMKHRRM